MKWEFLICIVIIWKYGLVPIAIKKIGAAEGSRTRKLVWQFFFAATLAIITMVAIGQFKLNWSIAVVAGIGAANAFGCYCHWRAYDISMSRTAMFSNLDDLVAIGLGYLVLGELEVLTPVLAAGVAVSIISAIVLARMKCPKNGLSAGLIFWVLGYSGIWGVAMFSMRFFSVRGLSLPTFVAVWYTGAWLGALFTRFAIMGRDEAGPPLTHTQIAKVFLLAIAIWTSLMLAYWLRGLAPITVIQPILLVAEMALPAIIALVFLGEARGMSRREIIAISVGLIGVALVALGFRQDELPNFAIIAERVSGALYLLGYAPYLWYIARDKRAKPLWAPWLIFSTVESIVLWEMRASQSDNWQLWGAMIGSWVAFAATLIYGKPGFIWLDAACLGAAIASVVVWQVYGQLTLGLMMSLGAIAIGMIPIFISAWHDPKGEDKAGWTMFWVSCVFATAAIPEWDLANAAQPISFLFTETIVMILLWYPRKLTAKS